MVCSQTFLRQVLPLLGSCPERLALVLQTVSATGNLKLAEDASCVWVLELSVIQTCASSVGAFRYRHPFGSPGVYLGTGPLHDKC
jgi:hypothetical protein